MNIELEKIRRYNGVSQKELAEIIGVSERSYINKICGVSQFKLREMFIISKEFKKPIGEIFLENDFVLSEVEEGNE